MGDVMVLQCMFPATCHTCGLLGVTLIAESGVGVLGSVKWNLLIGAGGVESIERSNLPN